MSEESQLLSPAELYEKLSTPRLLTGFYLQNRLFDMQVYLMLLHRGGLPLPGTAQEWHRQAMELKIADLEVLYQRSRENLLVESMVYLKVHWHAMLTEIYRRFQNKPTGLNILLQDWQKVQSSWIQKRRLKVDPEETKQSGVLKGLEVLNDARVASLEEPEHKDFLNLPPPKFPLSMDELERRAWDALLEDMWQPSLAAAFKNVVPLLRGDIEGVGGAVDNFLHNEQRRFIRHKSILGTSESIIKSEIHPEVDEKSKTEEPDVSEREFRVLASAKKRWGAKAVKALRYRLQGKTEEEAADRAGISVRTLQNYLQKLKKEFS